MIASTPSPPYYAVIFTTTRTDHNTGYQEMAEKMLALAAKQPGFLGVESTRDGLGITVSYWKDLDAIQSWRDNAEHAIAKAKGKSEWYATFKTRIAKVERDY